MSRSGVCTTGINKDYYEALEQREIYGYHVALKKITQIAESLGVFLVVGAIALATPVFLTDLVITVSEVTEYWYGMIIVGSMAAGSLLFIASSYGISRLALRLLPKGEEQSSAQTERDPEALFFPFPTLV